MFGRRHGKVHSYIRRVRMYVYLSVATASKRSSSSGGGGGDATCCSRSLACVSHNSDPPLTASSVCTICICHIKHPHPPPAGTLLCVPSNRGVVVFVILPHHLSHTAFVLGAHDKQSHPPKIRSRRVLSCFGVHHSRARSWCG